MSSKQEERDGKTMVVKGCEVGCSHESRMVANAVAMSNFISLKSIEFRQCRKESYKAVKELLESCSKRPTDDREQYSASAARFMGSSGEVDCGVLGVKHELGESACSTGLSVTAAPGCSLEPSSCFGC